MENSDKKKKQRLANQTRQVPTFDARRLFGDGNEVRLHYCSQEYRLMLTRNNKLILIK